MLIKHPWYVRKPYVHFDRHLDEKDATVLVEDKKLVAHHSFYPFIRYYISTDRIRHVKDPSGVKHVELRDPKSRPISYPSHQDGYILSYYKYLLRDRYEDYVQARDLEHVVTAYRKLGKNNVKLAKIAFDYIKAVGDCDILVTDITKFYEKIRHDILKQMWCMILGVTQLPDDHYNVYKGATKYSFVTRHQLYNKLRLPLPPLYPKINSLSEVSDFRKDVVAKGLIVTESNGNVGIPQGSPLSPLLSNIYLLDVDRNINDGIQRLGGRFWRYVDDILVVVPKGRYRDAEALVQDQMDEVGLSLHPDKTFGFHSYVDGDRYLNVRPLQYLGISFDGSEAWIRPSSVHRYKRKARKGIAAAWMRRKKERSARYRRARKGEAPLRMTALVNMYTDGKVIGKTINEQNKSRPYSGNFITYMNEAANILDSERIKNQKRQLLKKLRKDIKKASAK